MVVIILIEYVSMLLMMLKDCCRSAFLYCIVCMSRFPLAPLPLSDCVLVVVDAAVPVALGGKDMLTMLLISDMLTLLLMIKDCSRSAFFVIAMFLSVCHDYHWHCHYWIAIRL